uniref:Hormone-sensitive lipase n=1 Tax=Ganoderma boninense TaxID=34458 RepID=A0A5K1K7R3_9APHY|nr:Hormone-sensitive lipase [Ganoderma boninense]
MGLYTHPIHVSLSVPGTTASKSTIAMINQFLDWAQEQPNTWIVSSEQLLAWVRNPVPLSQLNDFAPLKCSTPAVNSSLKICNGIPQNEAGLLDHCAFNDFPFYTCNTPTPSNPSPAQASGSAAPRVRLSSNCSTPFWDPIKGECICTSSTCAFTDTSRPIGPNGANLTGSEINSTDGSAATQSSDPYVPFNGAASMQLPVGVSTALLVGVVGAFVGALQAVARL